jgi:metallo-beta-lactamase family protein
MASLTFLGAAQTVTGSRHLLRTRAGHQVLVDAGLFQGKKQLRERNWAPWERGPLDAVVLTHAHIDHTGYLPRLVAQGLVRRAVCTRATKELAGLLLPDSGHIQEEDARHANENRYSKHSPALPLYTEEQGRKAAELLEGHPYGAPIEVAPGVTVIFRRAGHIVGSSFLEVVVTEEGRAHRILFSGDVGRYGTPLLADPSGPLPCDTLLLESTYGDRLHAPEPGAEVLAREVNAALARGGPLLIPAFAVGRTQELLFLWRRLEHEGRIPRVPIFVDSPMANDATPIYLRHPDDQSPELKALLQQGGAPLHPEQLTQVRGGGESRRLLERRGFFAVIAASGMATGGRILAHLERHLPSPAATVLLVGYQADETRGRRLLDGAKSIKLRGGQVEVNAQIVHLSGFSAHADWSEEDRWLAGLQQPPAQTFLVHGEPAALQAQAARLGARGWKVAAPEHGETVELGA